MIAVSFNSIFLIVLSSSPTNTVSASTTRGGRENLVDGAFHLTFSVSILKTNGLANGFCVVCCVLCVVCCVLCVVYVVFCVLCVVYVLCMFVVANMYVVCCVCCVLCMLCVVYVACGDHKMKGDLGKRSQANYRLCREMEVVVSTE